MRKQVLVLCGIFLTWQIFYAFLRNVLIEKRMDCVSKTEEFLDGNAILFNNTQVLSIDFIMTRRRQKVKEVCKTKLYDERNGFRSGHKRSNIYVDHKHKILLCTIPKVSGTSWKKKLLAMNSVESYTQLENQPGARHRDIDKALKRHKVETFDAEKHSGTDLKEYTKLLFVRDPIERLISAFNDKFHPNQKSNFYFKKYGPEILNYPHTHNADIYDVRNVTFEQFVTYIVGLHQNHKTYKYDKHWDSYNNLCLPCEIHYDIIGKMETLEADVTFSLRTIIKNEADRWFPSVLTPRKAANSSLSNKYLQTLSPTQLQQLKQVYKIDYDLFYP